MLKDKCDLRHNNVIQYYKTRKNRIGHALIDFATNLTINLIHNELASLHKLSDKNKCANFTRKTVIISYLINHIIHGIKSLHID